MDFLFGNCIKCPVFHGMRKCEQEESKKQAAAEIL